jgi:hypothetical protein
MGVEGKSHYLSRLQCIDRLNWVINDWEEAHKRVSEQALRETPKKRRYYRVIAETIQLCLDALRYEASVW